MTADGLPTGSERETVARAIESDPITRAILSASRWGPMSGPEAFERAEKVRAALAASPPEAKKESVQKALNLAMEALHEIAYGLTRNMGRTAMDALQQITEVTSGAPPEASEEPERISSKTWDALEAIRARIARHGYDDLQREMADIIDRLVPPVEPEGDGR